MPKLTLSMFEPIEVVIGPDAYRIDSLSSRMLQELQVAVEKLASDPDELKVGQVADLLMKLLPGISREKAEQVDVRHVIRIAEFLTQQIEDAGKPGTAEKN